MHNSTFSEPRETVYLTEDHLLHSSTEARRCTRRRNNFEFLKSPVRDCEKFVNNTQWT